MFNIGGTELLVILIIAFVVVGPKDLPKIAGAIGRLIRKIVPLIKELKKETGFDEVEQELKGMRSEVVSVGREVSGTLKEADIRADLKKEMDSIKAETRDAVNLAKETASDAVSSEGPLDTGNAELPEALRKTSSEAGKKKPSLGYKEFAAWKRSSASGQRTSPAAAPQPSGSEPAAEENPETGSEAGKCSKEIQNTEISKP